MHDIKWIRANADEFDRRLSRRKGVPHAAAALIALDDARRAAILALEELQARRNAASKLIGRAKAQKDEARAQELMDEVAGLKNAMPGLEQAQRDADKALNNALAETPNLPLVDVPEGDDEHANVPFFRPNESEATRPRKPAFEFKPREHFELGEALGQMDFEAAARISGSRFVVLKSELARLSRAIGQFMLDLHTEEHGYTEVQPPLLVRDEALYGTGQLPKFEEDLFVALKPSAFEEIVRHGAWEVTRWPTLDTGPHPTTAPILDLGGSEARGSFEFTPEFFDEIFRRTMEEMASGKFERFHLIPTAEVPLTNLVRESLRPEAELPLRYTALTPCFRSEAGSAGRDTRGMIRQHQFDKVEMVAIATPEQAAAEHEHMLASAEAVLKRLGLHYRVVMLCTGDMGFGAQKTYDIEVWLPGQDAYREISSVSVCGDFQARRMDARYRDAAGKPQFVHTLNGSGVAVGRALVAVMENYQQEDGSIRVPDALVPYMRGKTVIGAAP